jgi:hypothetical protein
MASAPDPVLRAFEECRPAGRFPAREVSSQNGQRDGAPLLPAKTQQLEGLSQNGTVKSSRDRFPVMENSSGSSITSLMIPSSARPARKLG